jgi:hypothetical protein
MVGTVDPGVRVTVGVGEDVGPSVGACVGIFLPVGGRLLFPLRDGERVLETRGARVGLSDF